MLFTDKNSSRKRQVWWNISKQADNIETLAYLLCQNEYDNKNAICIPGL